MKYALAEQSYTVCDIAAPSIYEHTVFVIPLVGAKVHRLCKPECRSYHVE